MALEVRPARRGDGRRIEEIRTAGWKTAYAGLIDADWLAALRVRDERVASWDQRITAPSPGSATLVAEVGGRIEGFASLLPSQDADAVGAAELAALYVDPERHRAGIGSALLTAGLALMPQATQILWVLEGNTAGRRFYETHGFAPDGARKLLDIGGEVPELRYRRAVSPRPAQSYRSPSSRR